MTRTIKFRAWSALEQKMICPVAINDQGFPYIWDDKFLHLIPMASTYYHDGVAPPVMQFTGFLDRKGKEIYEGDVIQWKSSFPGIGSVYWNQEENSRLREKIKSLFKVRAWWELTGNICWIKLERRQLISIAIFHDEEGKDFDLIELKNYIPKSIFAQESQPLRKPRKRKK